MDMVTLQMSIRWMFILAAMLLLPAFYCHAASAAAAAGSVAAEKGFRPLKAGTEFKCEYFSLVLPKGWTMPRPLNKRPDGLSAVFATADEKLAVTLNVFQSNLTAAKLAEITADNMRKSGLKIGKTVKNGKFYKIDISAPVTGQAWFGSAGKICTAAVLLGPDSGRGEAILQAIRPPGLFPGSLR